MPNEDSLSDRGESLLDTLTKRKYGILVPVVLATYDPLPGEDFDIFKIRVGIEVQEIYGVCE